MMLSLKVRVDFKYKICEFNVFFIRQRYLIFSKYVHFQKKKSLRNIYIFIHSTKITRIFQKSYNYC